MLTADQRSRYRDMIAIRNQALEDEMVQRQDMQNELQDTERAMQSIKDHLCRINSCTRITLPGIDGYASLYVEIDNAPIHAFDTTPRIAADLAAAIRKLLEDALKKQTGVLAEISDGMLKTLAGDNTETNDRAPRGVHVRKKNA